MRPPGYEPSPLRSYVVDTWIGGTMSRYGSATRPRPWAIRVCGRTAGGSELNSMPVNYESPYATSSSAEPVHSGSIRPPEDIRDPRALHAPVATVRTS